MDVSLTIGSSSFRHLHPPRPSLCPSISTTPRPSAITPRDHKFTITASSSSSSNNPIPSRKPIPFISHLKTTAAAVVFAAAVFVKFQQLPSKAEVSAPPANLMEELKEDDTQLLESNPEAVDALITLLQQKLEAGEGEESLNILKKLISSQPENTEWKFFTARILNVMGRFQETRVVLEEIVEKEGEAFMKMLEAELRIAEEDNKPKEARDVKLKMARVQFLQKNVEEALMSYDELIREDPNDFRPYFSKGVIYSFLDRNEEAREQFSKFLELSPKEDEAFWH